MDFLLPINSLARSIHLQQQLKRSLAGKHDHIASLYKQYLPNFIVIGAAKSATTSLAKIMTKHKDIHFSSAKEPKFFGRNYLRGWDWYGHFSSLAVINFCAEKPAPCTHQVVMSFNTHPN